MVNDFKTYQARQDLLMQHLSLIESAMKKRSQDLLLKRLQKGEQVV